MSASSCKCLLPIAAVLLNWAAVVHARDADDSSPVLAPVDLPAPIITQHTGVFGGKSIAYQGVVEPFEIDDPTGKPIARLVATSYIAQTDEPQQRAVLFVFNGGPIVATTLLHMGAFGPRRVAVPDDLDADPATFKVVDNVYAPLDVADVVIFDPASTGFSRMAPGVAPESQFSVAADGWQLTQLVIQWSRTHGRTDSPKYLVGESYGTLRAVEAAEQLQAANTPLAGVMLLGQAVNIIEYAQRPGNIISYVVSLPTLAAIGWHHDVVMKRGRSFEQFIKDAQDYAAGEYLSVLFQGDHARLAKRKAVARKLHEFTGLPAETYLAANLKVPKTQYQRELFPGRILDTNDARYATPAGGVGAQYISRHGPAAVEQLHTQLNVPEVGEYFTGIAVRGDFGVWDWGPNKTPFGDWPYVAQLRGVMQANPTLRVFVANGYHDTQTTIGAMDYFVSQAGFPRERVRTRYYQGGHVFYSVEASLKRFSDDVRDMVNKKW